MKLKKDRERFVVKSQNTKSKLLKGKNLFQFKLIAFLLLLVAFGAITNACIAATYYIDATSGNDSANGSSSSPWKTVNKAKSTVSAGDVVNLRPGNYGAVTFTTSDKKGTSSNYITYQNDPASSPYSAKFTYILFDGNTSFYTTVKGFDIQNTGSNDACVKTENASYVKIQDCKTHGLAGGTGPSYANIFIHASKNVLVEDCEVYYGGDWAFAIQMESSQYVTVRGCHVHDIVGSGIRTGGGQDYVIEYNIVHDQRPEWNPNVHGTGIAIHSINTEIRGNIVYNYGNTRPIRFYQEYAGPEGYTNMTVEDNLVYKTADFTGTQWWVEFIDVGSNCTFRNNTFIGDVTISIVSAANSSTISIHDNIMTGNLLMDPYSKWSGISDGSNLFGTLSASGCGWRCNYDRISSSSNTRSNVSFSGFFATQDKHYPYTSGYPYQLSSSCAAVNFGDSYASPTDLLQCARVGKADAGCYEYGGIPGGTTPPQNQPPVANAGPDQTLTDISNNGSEELTLDGSGSTDPDGSIASYKWTENSTQIATGVKPAVTLSTGVHTITLTVTDNANATASDTVKITINQQNTTPPVITSVTPALNSVDIVFDKTMNTASAQTAANYTIDNGISVTKASLNNNIVTLTTSAHTELAQYKVTCTNITDSAGNQMPQTTRQYTYSPGLAACWMFDEPSGSTVLDSSGKAYNGSLVNGTLRDGLGALSFDGTNDHVSCSNGASLNITGSLTVTACINPESFGQGGWGRIVDKSNGSTGFSVLLEQATESLTYVVYGGLLVRSDSQAIKLNEWQHIAVVYDQSNDTVTFYINGHQVGTTDYTTPPTNSSASPLFIGIRGYDSARAFDGLIDNVRVYDRPLDSSQIAKIHNADFPFAFYTIGDKTVYENSTLSFEVFTRSPQIVAALSDHDLPTQPSFVNNIFSWDAGPDDSGTYSATFTATDGQIEDAETITIIVNNVNKKPEIETISNKSVDENETLTFDVIASDPDGDSVTCSAENLPAGAAFDGNTFLWTPTSDQIGNYVVTFIASDGQLENAENVNITVNDIPVIIVNRKPEIETIGNKSVDENETLTFDVIASDPDGDSVTCSAKNLPDGAAFDGNTFQWIPNSSQAGSYVVSFIASDGQLEDAENVTITVNDAPLAENTVVIIDNGDPQTSSTGIWQISGASGSYGTDSIWSRDGGTYTYTFSPPKTGTYNFDMYWTEWPSRSSSIPVSITHAGGIANVYIDQLQNGSQWNNIGKFTFNAGTIYKVTITSQPNPTSTCADAVRFTFTNEQPDPNPQDVVVIIDNDAPQTSKTGTWQLSGASGQYGSDSVWGRDGATFTYNFTPPVTGNYNVEMWWTEWPSRSSSVPVRIWNAAGSPTVYVNQLKNGSCWNMLGNYLFQAGTSYRVRITSQANPTSSCADAMRFTLTK